MGGLIVLFVYITRLASNELMNIKINTYSTLSIFTRVILIFIIININSQLIIINTSSVIKTFHFIYTWNAIRIIIITIIYLLLTLIIVVKISNKFEAPIKNLIFK